MNGNNLNIINGMSLAEKVGQLFMVGFSGPELTAEIKELILTYRIGGIIYFSRNIKSPAQVGNLSRELQKLARENNLPPLFIATDQEGGIVSRLQGATHYPGNMILGATGSSELTYQTGQLTARELVACGINMNLAPVLDINNNPDNPVIGVRSFGDDPELVAELGTAYIRGLDAEGVIACAKHFPGHGDTNTDSHYRIPVISHDLDHLERVELLPFRRAIEEGVDTLMTTHIYFPAIEPIEGVPATLSSKVIEGFLRKELGFAGVVVTDCLEMAAISNSVGTAQGAVLTIKAGCDIALVSHTFSRQKAALEAVLAAVRKGELSEERLDESLYRILSLKKMRLNSRVLNGIDPHFFPNQQGEELAYRIAVRGLTLFKNRQDLLPLKRNNGKQVLVIGPVVKYWTIAEDHPLINNLLPAYLKANGLWVDQFIPEEGQGLVEQLPESYCLNDYALIIFMSHNAAGDSRQIRLVKELNEQGFPLLVIAIRNPYDLQVFDRVSTCLITYDYSPAVLKAAADIICGRAKPGGKVPVKINFPAEP